MMFSKVSRFIYKGNQENKQHESNILFFGQFSNTALFIVTPSELVNTKYKDFDEIVKVVTYYWQLKNKKWKRTIEQTKGGTKISNETC